MVAASKVTGCVCLYSLLFPKVASPAWPDYRVINQVESLFSVK